MTRTSPQPLPARTTGKLTDYRRQLEHGLTLIPATTLVRTLLPTRLAQLAGGEP